MNRSVDRIAQIIGRDAGANVAVRDKVGHRVGGGIGRQTGAVPDVAGTEEGQHQKNARMPSPLLKSLPEIGVVFGHVRTRSDIEDAAEAKDGI